MSGLGQPTFAYKKELSQNAGSHNQTTHAATGRNQASYPTPSLANQSQRPVLHPSTMAEGSGANNESASKSILRIGNLLSLDECAKPEEHKDTSADLEQAIENSLDCEDETKGTKRGLSETAGPIVVQDGAKKKRKDGAPSSLALKSSTARKKEAKPAEKDAKKKPPAVVSAATGSTEGAKSTVSIVHKSFGGKGIMQRDSMIYEKTVEREMKTMIKKSEGICDSTEIILACGAQITEQQNCKQEDGSDDLCMDIPCIIKGVSGVGMVCMSRGGGESTWGACDATETRTISFIEVPEKGFTDYSMPRNVGGNMLIIGEGGGGGVEGVECGLYGSENGCMVSFVSCDQLLLEPNIHYRMSNDNDMYGRDVLRLTNCTNMRITSNMFSGKSANFGLVLDACSNIMIDNCSFLGCGISMTGSCTGITIRGCHMQVFQDFDSSATQLPLVNIEGTKDTYSMVLIEVCEHTLHRCTHVHMCA